MAKNRKNTPAAQVPATAADVGEADALELVRASVDATGTNPAAAAALAEAAAAALDAGNAEQANPTVTPVADGVVPTVALRGGLAVGRVQLTGKPYRTAAAHNRAWWDALCAALATGPAPVAPLLASQTNPQGVPSHFVGYVMRRGYLKAAD